MLYLRAEQLVMQSDSWAQFLVNALGPGPKQDAQIRTSTPILYIYYIYIVEKAHTLELLLQDSYSSPTYFSDLR